jgi:hypothetical protein
MSFHAAGAPAADALGAALVAVAAESVGAAELDGVADAALLVSVGAGGLAGGVAPPPHAAIAITGAAHTKRKAVRRMVFIRSPGTLLDDLETECKLHGISPKKGRQNSASS